MSTVIVVLKLKDTHPWNCGHKDLSDIAIYLESVDQIHRGHIESATVFGTLHDLNEDVAEGAIVLENEP